MKTEAPTTVRVTEDLIREAIPGNCFRCAVARAMAIATGDDEAHIVERDWMLHVVVWGRYMVAPPEVRQFVYAYDFLERMKEGRAKLSSKTAEDLEPFDFDLPPVTDPRWQESCYGCEFLFDPEELDEEGYCEECRGGQKER